MRTSIQPVSVFPGQANELFVADNWSNSLDSAPQFYFELRQTTEDQPTVPLKTGNVSMTVDQWSNWAIGANDEEYILFCIMTNLGLTPAT